ncbi:MAG: GNAT family N-acetyltransferase [Candidatus Saccharimonadales bacterium]
MAKTTKANFDTVRLSKRLPRHSPPQLPVSNQVRGRLRGEALGLYMNDLLHARGHRARKVATRHITHGNTLAAVHKPSEKALELLGLCVASSTLIDGEAYINGLVVAPLHRRTHEHIGAFLVWRMAEVLKPAGVTALGLTTDNKERQTEFYESLGFREAIHAGGLTMMKAEVAIITDVIAKRYPDLLGT